MKIFFDDDFKESVKVTILMFRNAISANPEHYIFKIFRGSMPRSPLEGLKNFLITASWLKKLFQNQLPPQTKNPR